MRPLTLNDFYDAEGSTLTLSDPDPDDEPLPLDGPVSTSTEEKQLMEGKEGSNGINDGAMPGMSNDEDVDFER